MNAMPDDKWLAEMTLELRLRNVPGAAIGDALAAVEAHCADAGQSAAEAFGDPRQYARSLTLPTRQPTATLASRVGLTVPIAAGLAGAFLAPPLVRALHAGAATAAVSWGQLLSLGLVGVLVWLALQLLRPLLENWLVGTVFFGGGVVALALLPRLVPATAFALRPWLLGLVCLALLTVSVVGQRAAARQWDDPIVDPRTPTRRPAPLGQATQWLFVLVALGLGLLELATLLWS